MHLVIKKSCLRKLFEKNFSINTSAALRRLLKLVGSSARAFTRLANGPAFFSNNLSICAGLIVGANMVSLANSI